jgi:hypothetical protein
MDGHDRLQTTVVIAGCVGIHSANYLFLVDTGSPRTIDPQSKGFQAAPGGSSSASSLRFLSAKGARDRDECGEGNGGVIIRSDEIV